MKKLFDVRINSRYLLFLLKQNRKLMVVLTLIYILLLPFSYYTNHRYMMADPSYFYHDPYNHLSAIIFHILFSILIPCLLLSFIMDKNKLDTYQTLPIRKQDLYYNHFIESLLVLLIPLTIGFLLYILVGFLMFPGLFLVMDTFIVLLKVIAFTPLMIGVTHFGFISSGRLFDGLFYSGLIHLTQFFLYFVVTNLFSQRLVGLTYYLNTNIASYLSFDIALFAWLNKEFFGVITIVWILLGLVLYFVNQQLYVHRKVENVDDSAVFPWFIPLVTSIIFTLFMSFLFVIFLPYRGFMSSIGLPLLFGLISYLVVDGIIHRGFQYIYRAAIRYGVIAIVSIALIYSSIYTGFFGLTKQIPTMNDFDTVLILSTNFHQTHHHTDDNKEILEYFESNQSLGDVLNLGYYYEPSLFANIYESESERERVLDFHKYLIDNYYQNNNPIHFSYYDSVLGSHKEMITNNAYNVYYDYTSEYFIIYLKDKQIVSRRMYYMYQSDFDDLMVNFD